MSNKPERSRKRIKNFDNLEREVLLEAAFENKEIIDSKFTNQITNVKKKSTERGANEGQCPQSCKLVGAGGEEQMEQYDSEGKREHGVCYQGQVNRRRPPPSPILSRIIDVYGDSHAFSVSPMTCWKLPDA